MKLVSLAMLILLVLLPLPLLAADPGECSWQPAGWMTLLAVDPVNSQILYARDIDESGLGLWKSDVAGAVWYQSGSELDGTVVQSLEVDRNDSRALYAGTSVGVYKSTDGGGSWQLASPLGPAPLVVGKLLIAPSESNVLYADTSAGIFRSDDRGSSWHLAIAPLPGIYNRLTAIDPSDSQTIFTVETTEPHAMRAMRAKLIRWVNGGTTNSGSILSLSSGIYDLVIDPANPQRFFATGGVLQKSSDGGLSWMAFESGLMTENGFTESAINSLSINPLDGQALYAATNGGGILVSSDGGNSWRACNQGMDDLHIGKVFLDEANGRPLFFQSFLPAIRWDRHSVYRNNNNPAAQPIFPAEDSPPPVANDWPYGPPVIGHFCCDNTFSPTSGSFIIPTTDDDGNYTIKWDPSPTRGVQYILQESTVPAFPGNWREVYRGRAPKAKIKQRLAGHTYYYNLQATHPTYGTSTNAYDPVGCQVPHIVSAKANAGGTISPTGRIRILVGTEKVFAITPNPGYHTVSVLVDGIERGAVASVSAPAALVPNVKNKHSIKAKFAINTYQATSTAGAGGRILPAGTKAYRHGKRVTYTVKPDRGYRVGSVQVNGVEQTGLPASGSYRLRLTITEATQVTATFVPLSP